MTNFIENYAYQEITIENINHWYLFRLWIYDNSTAKISEN